MKIVSTSKYRKKIYAEWIDERADFTTEQLKAISNIRCPNCIEVSIPPIIKIGMWFMDKGYKCVVDKWVDYDDGGLWDCLTNNPAFEDYSGFQESSEYIIKCAIENGYGYEI